MTLKEQASALYKTAFPDDPDDFALGFINRFFEKNCRYILKDDRIASMLFLLDGSLKENGGKRPALYLYAAATLPEYRGMGLMAGLIEKAKAEAKEKGAFLLTKPATPSLFSYYESFGFKTAVFSEEKLVKRETDQKPLGKIGFEEYERLKEKLLENTPHVNLTDSKYVLSFFDLFGDENTVAAVDTAEEPPVVKEFITGDGQGRDRLLASLNSDEAIFRINGNTPFAMTIPPTDTSIHFMLALD